MIFYGYLYSPLLLAIPRFDFVGFATGVLYTWSWIICMIVREVDCLRSYRVFAYLVPQYVGWLALFCAQLMAIVLFWFDRCGAKVKKKISWQKSLALLDDKKQSIGKRFLNRVVHFNQMTVALFVGDFR